jgi:hypothetical protein
VEKRSIKAFMGFLLSISMPVLCPVYGRVALIYIKA